MKMKTVIVVFLLCLNTLGVFAQDGLILKKRIAILSFEDVSGNNAGSILTDMITTEMVNTNKFQVIERSQIQSVLNEQDFGTSGRVTPESAAKLNQILGVQIIVYGSITEYSYKRETEEKGVKIYKKTKTIEQARVAIDIRMMSATTGEIIAAQSAVGEKSSESEGTRIATYDESKTSDDQTIFGIAKREAVQKSVKLITAASTKVQWRGKVVSVNADKTIIIRPGSTGGAKSGMKFNVYSTGEHFKDPETGESLGFDSKKTAEIEVLSDIGEGVSCKAKIISGSGVKVGDTFGLDEAETASENQTGGESATEGYPTPDFDNFIYFIEGSNNSFTELERADNASMKSSPSVKNLSSPVSIKQQAPHQFFVRLLNGADPYTSIELMRCTLNTKNSTRDFSSKTGTKIQLKFKKLEDNSFLITLHSPLNPGEYFFFNNQLEDKEIFAFSVK